MDTNLPTTAQAPMIALIKTKNIMNNNKLKTKTKRAFALLLMLALLAPAAAWAQNFGGGSGTETAPYLIATTDDMDALASQVNGGNSFSGTYFKMTADLDYTGKGYSIIGNYDNRFCGSFNGDGHTISNVSLSGNGDTKGVFGAIGSGGIVMNLTLDQSSISGISGIGGIAGYIENATISNCINRGSITTPNFLNCQSIGGIVGYATNSSIIDCQNQGEVRRHDNAVCSATGGIVGRAENNCNISGCQNSAYILGTENTGGIAGQANGGTIISHCKSTEIIQGESRGGGIVGYANGAIVSHCYNLARVTAYSGPAGGIVGRAEASSVSNCLSLGRAQGYSNYSYASGGIVGWNYGDGNSYTNNYYRGNTYGICDNSTTMPIDVPGQAMMGYAVVSGLGGITVGLEGNVGLAYEGTLYAGNGERLPISINGPEGYDPSEGYNASAGTLTPNGDTWTLLMPQEDVTITPTSCFPITITADVPYFENFENYALSALPYCWEAYTTGATAPSVFSQYGSKYLRFTDNSFAILPEFSNPINQLQISFWMKTDNNNCTLQLGYLTAEDDGTCSSFTTIVTYSNNNGNQIQQSTVLENVPAEAYRLAFNGARRHIIAASLTM